MWQIRVNDIHFKSSSKMERVCDHCRSLNNGAGTTECEDEYHVVFKCPLYAECRDKYTQLFVTDDLKKFLEYKRQESVGCFFLEYSQGPKRQGTAMLDFFSSHIFINCYCIFLLHQGCLLPYLVFTYRYLLCL